MNKLNVNDYKENIIKIIDMSYTKKIAYAPSALSQLMYFQYLLPKVRKFDWVAGKQFGWQAYRIFYNDFNIEESPKNVLLLNRVNPEFKYVEETLGNALGVSIGLALTQNKPIWLNLSDSVFQMGRVLEALPLLVKFNLNILITVDFNNATRSKQNLYKNQYIKNIITANNIKVHQMDAENPEDKIIDEFIQFSGPRVLIFNTIKGFGVKLFEENQIEWHYKEIDQNSYKQIMKDLS